MVPAGNRCDTMRMICTLFSLPSNSSDKAVGNTHSCTTKSPKRFVTFLIVILTMAASSSSMCLALVPSPLIHCISTSNILSSARLSTHLSFASSPYTLNIDRSPPTTTQQPLRRNQSTYTAVRHDNQLNLIPLSQAWDASNSNDTKSRDATNTNQSFASLVPKLGCSLLDENGTISSTSPNGVNLDEYTLYLANHVDDLPPIAHLTIEVFDATAITLASTSDWSAWEKALMGVVLEPAVGMYNSYANAVAYTEVLSGLRRRMRNRISVDDNVFLEGNRDGYDWLAPLVVPEIASSDTSSQKQSTLEEIAARSSLILALARPNNKSSPSDEDMEMVASVEVRLQPTDAKIPFSQPWLDNVERRLARFFDFIGGDKSQPTIATNKSPKTDSTSSTMPSTVGTSKSAPLRPYLCNLCVSPSLRSLGIGRALCRIVESIAREKWGYDHVYLHVDPTNDAARTLYEKEGYIDVGKRWNAVWAGGANEIGYYVKRLE